MAILLTALGAAHAQSGAFVIPPIRANGGTDFAYWDWFARPPGSSVNSNFNFSNPPALLNGEGKDFDDNPTTAFADRTVLKQTGTATAFITSSGAIYSFAEITSFEVPYQPKAVPAGEVTNVIFQTQTGGSRLNFGSVFLQYKVGAQTFSVAPTFRALDDPQTGNFSERIVSGFQWDLTGLNVRNFTIVFAAPDASMPLWEAQLDVVAGSPFVQELGYLLSTRSRPLTRFGRSGSVDKNLPGNVDGRFFLPGEQLTLLGAPEIDWEHTGWFYDGQVTTGEELLVTFPAHDVTVTALFAPLLYDAWREVMFDHANGLIGAEDDYLDDTVSDRAVDHDGDGLSNAAEYLFSGDPYTIDLDRTLPQKLTVNVSGVDYPAVRYRTNGAPAAMSDGTFTVLVSADGDPFVGNDTTPTTTTVSRVLQPDGSVLVTERTLQPASFFSAVAFKVAWTLDGVAGVPLSSTAAVVTSPTTLTGGVTGLPYSLTLTGAGGGAPYTWSLLSGSLPSGTTLSAAGVLSGTPIAAGLSSFTVQLEDSNGEKATKLLNITILLAPDIATTSLPGGLTYAPYSTTLTATGGTAPYTWTLLSGTLPAGFTLSAGGVLSGLPTSPGVKALTVKITDGNNLTDTQALTLTIAASPVTITTTATLGGGLKGVPYSQTLKATGTVAPAVWTVESGVVPAGLGLSSAGVLSGTPTLIGTYTFTARLADNAGVVALKTFTLDVGTTTVKPVVDVPAFGTTTIGVDYNYTVIGFNYPTAFTFVGLPKGLKSTLVADGTNAKKAVISGKPTVSGVFNIKITASNKAGASTAVTVPLIVKALPNGFVGSFIGIIGRDPSNGDNGGLLTLTTTATGTFTAKATIGTTTKQVLGSLKDTAPQVVATLDNKPLSLTLNKDTNLLEGTYGAGTATVKGWRSVWDKTVNPAANLAGYYSAALGLKEDDIDEPTIPQGYGYVTFTVAPAGTLTVAGKTADNQTITTTGFVGPSGQIAVYSAMYGVQGSVLGNLKLSEDVDGLFTDNTVSTTVSETLTWRKPEILSSHAYPAAFAVSLNASGKYLAPAASGYEVLGLPDVGLADLLFEGVGTTATNPNVIGFTYTDTNKVVLPAAGSASNKAKAVLAINKASGAVTGSVTLVENSPALTRKVPFYGQTVRLADGSVKAVGCFLLPQIPAVGQNISVSPIYSGSVVIEQ